MLLLRQRVATLLLVTLAGCSADGDAPLDGSGSLDGYLDATLDAPLDAMLDGTVDREAPRDASPPDADAALACDPGCAPTETCRDGRCEAAPAWPRRLGGADDDAALALAVDPSGGVFVAGTFRDSLDTGSARLTARGGDDAFVASLTAAGAPRGSRRLGGAGEDAAHAVVASADTVRVAGSFAGTIDPGGRLVTSAGDLDGMVVALRPGGAPAGGLRFGGAAHDEARALGLAVDGTAFVAGMFVGHADFGAMSLTGAGGRDGFVLLLDRVASP